MTQDPVNPGLDSTSQSPESLIATLLIFVAKGDGTISGNETDKMLALVEQQFGLPSSESLALLTAAMSDLGDNPELQHLRGAGGALSDDDKEQIVSMLLKVIAADGRKDVEELGKLDIVADVMDITPEVMHKAFDRYFDESG